MGKLVQNRARVVCTRVYTNEFVLIDRQTDRDQVDSRVNI